MDIKTKFNIGQLVWYIEGNKIHKGTVHSISILVQKSYQHEDYSVTLGSGIITRNRDSIYESKEALIESIE